MDKNALRRVALSLCGYAALLLAACGGAGGGGGSSPGSATTPLASGSFVKTVDTTDTAYNSFPFSETWETKVQLLYAAAEVNGAGYINALRFRMGTAQSSVTTCPNMTIRMGHTNLAALTATFANNVETGQGSLQTVLNNDTVTIPAGAVGSWFEIPLATPFYYDGVDNLVVEFEDSTVCTHSVYTTYSDSAGMRTHSSAADAGPGTVEHNQTTGTVLAVQNWMKFVFAGGDDGVLYPNAAGNSIPFSTNTNYQHVQMLHLASDIDGSGPVTGIAMINNESPTDAATYTVNIKLGHTTFSALTDTFANNFNGGNPVTVASGLTFDVPAGVPAGAPIWLPLTGTFNYNGTDNLIVDIEVTAASGNTSWRYDSAQASRRLFATVGSATGTVQVGAYHTVFRFNGGPVLVMPPALGDMSFQVLGATAGQAQNLYRGSDLGTGGRINSVAVRLRDNSTATSLTNYKLYMGHTSKTALAIGDTYASNMDDATLVYNGTLDVPAGLKMGDWVTIPLQTPFSYDSTKNLTILFTTDVGSAGHNLVSLSFDSSRYPSFSSMRNDNAVDTSGNPSSMYSGLVDVRLGITK